MNKKLYYTDPLAAAYMAREFGVEFIPNVRGYSHAVIDLTLRGDNNEIVAWLMVDGELDGWNRRIGEALKPGEKIYIHPDSYDIFEPKVGDLYTDSNLLPSGLYGSVVTETDYATHAFKEDFDGRIIQRDNKPFFWPEVDDE